MSALTEEQRRALLDIALKELHDARDGNLGMDKTLDALIIARRNIESVEQKLREARAARTAEQLRYLGKAGK